MRRKSKKLVLRNFDSLFGGNPFPRPQNFNDESKENKNNITLPDIFFKRKSVVKNIMKSEDKPKERNRSVIHERKPPQLISSIFRDNKLMNIK